MPGTGGVPERRLFIRPLTDTGMPGGICDAIGDYENEEKDFFIEARPGEKLAIVSLVVSVVDAGTFDAGKYGNNIILKNGIKVRHVQSGKTGTLCQTVKTNLDWATMFYNTNLSRFGTGSDYLHALWEIKNCSGGPLVLYDGDRLVFNLHDDFTNLVSHRFMAHGSHLGIPDSTWAEHEL